MEKVEKKKVKMPKAVMDLIIGPNSYSIKIPNNGNFIDIEKLKIQLTEGTHSKMLYGNAFAQQGYVLVETIAALQILVPGLQKSLNVDSLMDCDPIQTKALVKSYMQEIFPWLQEIQKIANDEVDVEE